MEHRFILDKKTILPILSAFQPLCNKRTTIDATSHVLFHSGNRELVLKGTDLEVSLQASCRVLESSATVGESFLVQGKRLFESMREMEGPVTCVIESNQLVLQSAGVDLRLNIKSIDEFPPFPERIENLMHIAVSDFVAMLDSTIFLVPQNNSNPALNGLLMEVGPEGLSLTATDGHSLVHFQTEKYTMDRKTSWLIPRRAIFELKKLLEGANEETLFVGVSDGHIVFSGELFNFFTRLIAQPFPEYRPTLSRENFSAGTVDRQQCMKALRRAACLLSGQFIATRFTFMSKEENATQLHVRMENRGVGTLDEFVSVKSGTPLNFDIRFYAPYLLEGLQVFADPEVKFFVRNESSPIMFENNTALGTTHYLVMPVANTAR